MERDSVNWHDRVHLCRRSGRRGVRNAHLLTGLLSEAIHAAMERPADERTRLIIKYEFTTRRLSWSVIETLSRHPELPVLI